MTPTEFEALLDRAAQFLTLNLRTSTLCHGPDQFEQGVLAALQNAATDLDATVEPTYHRHAFPDIRVNGFGVEVKYSKRDTWNAVGNSVFESMRDPSVSAIYVMFGKVGGKPEASRPPGPRLVVTVPRHSDQLFGSGGAANETPTSRCIN